MEFDLEDRTIYYVRHGSFAYGTNIESSDEDFKGVAIAPLDYYLGCFKRFEQTEKYVSKGADKDEVIYDIQKFINMASNANPNIIEVLFVDESDIVSISYLGRMLRDHSDLFVTKKIRHSMAGYAHQQAHRIRTHRAWLLNPPQKKPAREDFGLSLVNKVTPSEMGAYEHVLSAGEVLPESIMSILAKEKAYARAKQNWDQYENWKKDRNKDRAALEAKHGYDTKHAYHLVRLMRMAGEILRGEGVKVKRKADKDELLAIRKGAWSYDKLMEWFDAEDKLLTELYEKSTLPFEPDHQELDNLSMKLIREWHSI
jgi:predicted nucleotidyltransferase